MIPAVTWIGHASTLVQAGGVIDPDRPDLFPSAPRRFPSSARSATSRRASPWPQLPHIDAVLISHNHYDHLDAASVRALAAQAGGPPLFIVPLGIKAWLADAGISHAVELDWWQSARVGAARGRPHAGAALVGTIA